MNTYQKVAALVIRLVSLGLIIYSGLAAVTVMFVMRSAVWISLPSLAAGVLLFICAIPLARIVAGDFED
jgi:hypothetical protein